MANDALKNKWQPVVRWIPELRTAQTRVLAETGIWVPLIRALAHIGLETGYTGDPKTKSKGPGDCCGNRCPSRCGACCKPGKDCPPDCHFHGLFQMFWPPFSGVDWDNINDPGYNCYLGLKTLAIRYQQCGNWHGASIAFFAGSCVDMGTVDPNTNVDVSAYINRINANIGELETLGVGNETDDPKSPTNGGKNTKGDKPGNAPCTVILGQEICLPTPSLPSLDPVDIIRGYFEQYFPRLTFAALGIVLLAIGAFVVVAQWQ